MNLNDTQTANFKAFILADANLATFRTAPVDHGQIAAYYAASSGAGFMWRPSITISELNTAIVWSEFIALSVQTQNAYHALTQGGEVDSTSPNVRAGFASIFSGTSLTNLTALAKKVPTRFEALFNVSNVCPVFGQSASVAEIIKTLGA